VDPVASSNIVNSPFRSEDFQDYLLGWSLHT
jgi:hypothetical protein